MTIIVMRGLPGSGKSTIAKEIKAKLVSPYYEEHESIPVICSADYYYNNFETAPYKFDPISLPRAHAQCFGMFVGCLRAGGIPIIDNTHIQLYTAARVLDYVQTHNEKIRFIIPNTPWAWDVDECFKRCVHVVPIETIQRMKDTFEASEWDEIYDPNSF